MWTLKIKTFDLIYFVFMYPFSQITITKIISVMKKKYIVKISAAQVYIKNTVE